MERSCDTCRYNPEVWLCTKHALKENKSKFNCNGYEPDVKVLESQLKQSHIVIDAMMEWICDHSDCLTCPVYHPNEDACDSLIDYFFNKVKGDNK